MLYKYAKRVHDFWGMIFLYFGDVLNKTIIPFCACWIWDDHNQLGPMCLVGFVPFQQVQNGIIKQYWENISPRSGQYRPSTARSAHKRLRVNIFLVWSRASLVRDSLHDWKWKKKYHDHGKKVENFKGTIASRTVSKNRLHHQRPPNWLRQELQSGGRFCMSALSSRP